MEKRPGDLYWNACLQSRLLRNGEITQNLLINRAWTELERIAVAERDSTFNWNRELPPLTRSRSRFRLYQPTSIHSEYNTLPSRNPIPCTTSFTWSIAYNSSSASLFAVLKNTSGCLDRLLECTLCTRQGLSGIWVRAVFFLPVMSN